MIEINLTIGTAAGTAIRLCEAASSTVSRYWSQMHNSSAGNEDKFWLFSNSSKRNPADDYSWLKRFEEQVNQMESLPTDWSGYGAEAPNLTSRALAVRFLEVACEEGMQPVSVSPSVEEGVTVSFQRCGRRAAVEFGNDGSILAVKSDGASIPAAWSIDCEDFGSQLFDLRQFLYAGNS